VAHHHWKETRSEYAKSGKMGFLSKGKTVENQITDHHKYMCIFNCILCIKKVDANKAKN
jgi:hypothetical protein